MGQWDIRAGIHLGIPVIILGEIQGGFFGGIIWEIVKLFQEK